MLLAADVGNTNVVFALFEPDGKGDYKSRARWRIATDPRRTGDEACGGASETSPGTRLRRAADS